MRRSVCIAAMMCAGAACAGPEWPEVGDAGALPAGAQVVGTGIGPVTKIIGQLAGPPGLPDRGSDGDFQDMYLINIVDPLVFRASTSLADGGMAAFGSHLWLFNADGTALLGNLNSNLDPNGARLERAATDESGAEVVEAGLYYLAISSRAGSMPLGESGPVLAPMFEFVFPGEVSGPDGPGGFNSPIEGWQDGTEFGQYEIVLQGVGLVEPECRADLNNDNLLDFFDVQFFLQAFAGNDPVADWTKDGLFDFFDVLGFLNDFAAGCS